MAGTNGDLWQQVKQSLDNNEWPLVVTWVNSHPEEAFDIQLALPLAAYVGKAGEAAEEHRVLEGEVMLHKNAMKTSRSWIGSQS